MKRNRESKCRIKLIQEKNLSKEEQRALDAILTQQNKRYSTAYADYRNGLLLPYDLAVGMMRVGRAFAKAGKSASEAARAILNLEEAWRAALY